MAKHDDGFVWTPELRRAYEEDVLIGEVTDTIAALLESIGLTQRELAERLEVTESRVSQMLAGSANITLKTLADAGWAVGVRWDVAAKPMEDRACTPAEHDPPLPAWLSKLHEQQPLVIFHSASGVIHEVNEFAFEEAEAETPADESHAADSDLALAA